LIYNEKNALKFITGCLCLLISPGSRLCATKPLQGRPTFGFLQEAIESWLAGKTALSLVPDHVLARQACA
jgi:hypothetical protein